MTVIARASPSFTRTGTDCSPKPGISPTAGAIRKKTIR